MDSTRQSKISRLIQKELSEIFRLQTKALPGVIVSVTSVRVSADLSIARATLSIFPSDRAEELLKNIRSQASQVRFELGQRTRMQLRRIPELHFYIDDSLDYIERIDELLKK
ncbi:Ribosome-binding factor A [Porphyromonas crevioricanis]|uniref:Ribosome-binding factor A n=1 Tax=Porphyromonas crevioricanis TaxID=393921 RepID=A0A2X4PLG5_9PORP|nr:30S ribosome-binding factor RbfA [Porphyromonas crevioricanis]GAD08115.1 ribosome-binding factor A [Porphyromonas crevioricanis JCM 13913]SQH72298.1 Ribosome-binding factor A [Porphyromonas crevioricanis]